ncbi:MAG: hypothetical protein ACRDOX_08870, partial [Nocardioides sp.]
MRLRKPSGPHTIIALVATLSTLVVPTLATEAAAQPDPPGKPITVMTRNLYLGADINAPVRAVAGITDPTQAFLTFGRATFQTRRVVDQTSFPRRSELLASEIATNRPDLVGLQEVALWRSGPLEPTRVGVPNASTVDYDFLQILLQDLTEAGVEYRA